MCEGYFNLAAAGFLSMLPIMHRFCFGVCAKISSLVKLSELCLLKGKTTYAGLNIKSCNKVRRAVISFG